MIDIALAADDVELLPIGSLGRSQQSTGTRSVWGQRNGRCCFRYESVNDRCHIAEGRERQSCKNSLPVTNLFAVGRLAEGAPTGSRPSRSRIERTAGRGDNMNVIVGRAQLLMDGFTHARNGVNKHT